MSKAITLSIIIVILASVTLISQDRSFATLPLVKADSLIINDEDDLNHTEDYDHIVEIYNNLVKSRGDFRYPVPKLFLRDEEGYVAYIDYLTNNIVLEKKAYEVCKKYGDIAIAFLLGHELTHYYEKHAWKSGFARDNSDLKIGRNLQDVQDAIANETEADYLGGFLAYSAGYGMFDKGGQIINDLYTAYKLKDNIEGYPSKQDRITLGERSAKKLSLLVDAFEMANLLLASGNMEHAYSYYEYILNHYQNRELYNNIGTIAVLNAMELFDEDSLQFKYVTELDVNFTGSKDVDIPVNEQINRFLDQAIQHFNSAINLDPNYAPGLLNKANAYALKRDWVKANFYLNEEALPVAQKDSMTYKKTLVDIKILQGIIAAKTGDKVKARNLFKEAQSTGSDLAKENLRRMDNPMIQGSGLKINSISKDSLGAYNVKDFLKAPQFNQDKTISITNGLIFHQFNPEGLKARIFINQNDEKKIRTAFLMTLPGYIGATDEGIKLGDPDTLVVEKYGQPNVKIETTNGQIYSYNEVLFMIADQKVKQWINIGAKRFIF